MTLLTTKLRKGSRLGKYKLQDLLGTGGFSRVYRARDEIEGREVALKIPDTRVLDIDDLLEEVRITVRLEHPNILPIVNADIVDGQLLIAYPRGTEPLDERLSRRYASHWALDVFEQVLDAVAYAHEHKVIHCDIKPDNVILFADGTAKLGDFGIARVAMRTVLSASGRGTVGYMAPEQALGQPSFRSDVFALGLLAYRLFSGALPRWPYRRPLPNSERARKALRRDALKWIERAIEVDERKRFRNARHMQRALEEIGDPLR